MLSSRDSMLACANAGKMVIRTMSNTKPSYRVRALKAQKLVPKMKTNITLTKKLEQGILAPGFKMPPELNIASLEYDEEFGKVTTFESQMQSLASRGFQRSWRPFSPPKNVEEVFVSACQKAFGADKWSMINQDFSKVKIQGVEKVKLLSILAEDFGGHRVPNSLLHTMTTLDKVFTFYSTEVTDQSPYDLIESGVRQGTLPQNLHVQLEPYRFDPTTATSEIGKTSAFPRESDIFVTPEARKKFTPFKAKRSPYRNSEKDD